MKSGGLMINASASWCKGYGFELPYMTCHYQLIPCMMLVLTSSGISGLRRDNNISGKKYVSLSN